MTKGSSAYHFDQKLSENQVCSTWLATQVRTGDPCLVKVAASGTDADRDKNNRLLTSSFVLQKLIHSQRILRARGRGAQDGSVLIEYPYLEPANWQPLTPDYFRHHAGALLPQVGVTVDYLHGLGLVHADLKLENFMVQSHTQRLILADLDFLCDDGSSPEASLIGTRQHIAPEILSNDRLVVQSDNYSLGISIRRFLDEDRDGLPAASSPSDGILDRLRSHGEELLEPDYLKRPRILLDFFAVHLIISPEQSRKAEEELLGSILLTRLRCAKRSRLADVTKLDTFVHHDCHLLGLHPDALTAMAEAWGKSRLRTFQTVVKLLRSGVASRHYEFWHVEPSLEELTEFYDDLEHIAGDHAVPPSESCTSEYWLSRGKGLQESGLPERAMLAYHRGLSLTLGVAEPGAEGRVLALLEAGRVATQSGRLDLARKYFETAREHVAPDSAVYLAVLLEVALMYVRRQQVAEAQAALDEGLAVKPSPEMLYHHLKLRRVQGWLYIRSSDYVAAEMELLGVIESAHKLEMWEVEALGKYSLGVMEYRRGDFKKAHELLTDSYELADRQGLIQPMSVSCTTLASLCNEMADYAGAVKFGKLAAQLAASSHNATIMLSVCSALTAGYTRMGMYAKAHFWNEMYLRGTSNGSPKALLQMYFSDEGFVNSNEGDLHRGKQSYYRALEIARTESSFGTVGRIKQQLALNCLYGGDSSGAVRFAGEAIGALATEGDTANRAEVELTLLLDRVQEEGDGVFDEIVASAGKLHALSCRYYAALAVLQLMLLRGDRPEPWLNSLRNFSTGALAQSASPTLKAAHELIANLAPAASFGDRVGIWKRAFLLLLQAHDNFWASQIAIHIGELYFQHGQTRPSRTFFKKGRELAAKLPNERLVKRANTGLVEAERVGSDVSTLISSFVSISNILKDMSDFGGSLDRLIQFAVEQTGAERGVLLLKSPTGSNLQVGSAVNCDEQSLSDVLQISSRLPQSAFEEASPIVIDNAMLDERTRDYKSVHMHNVLSVACIPLIHDHQAVGVLYLDHHSIPALFEPEDLRYIESIANFLTVFLAMAREIRVLTTSRRELQGELNAFGAPDGFLTRDPAMLRMLEQLPQIAKTNASILLHGESGTGKELLCRMIHRLSLRAGEPLVKFNCASVTPSMIDSELFGVARGAATGVAERDGKFAAADGGTLFLDEIGDMPLEMQAKILRVLEYQEFEKVGSNRAIRVDVRFVHATNKDLPTMIADKKFREDLYFRINTVVIEVPALRDRPLDIPLLIDHYLMVFSKARKVARFTAEAMEKLLSYGWPGNARELRNLVERTCILYPGGKIEVNMLPAEIAKAKSDFSSARSMAERVEATAIRAALIRAKGNQSLAAQDLGMPLSTFRRKMKKYGIRFDQ